MFTLWGKDMRRYQVRLVSTAVVAALLAGGAFPTAAFATGIPLPLGWKNERKEYGIPDSIVAVWTYAVAHTPGQPPARGFGGRIMFFQDGREKPIKVDGTLVVYGFEEIKGQDQKVMPDRRYVFSPEELARCYSQSRLGHSYSIWIPWDEAGGPQRTISLIVCFTSRTGKTVVSQQSKMTLPGPRNDDQQKTSSGKEQTAAHQPRVWTVPSPVRGTSALPLSPTTAPSSSQPESAQGAYPGGGLVPATDQPNPTLLPPQVQWFNSPAGPAASGAPPMWTGGQPAVWATAEGHTFAQPPVVPAGSEMHLPAAAAPAQWATYQGPPVGSSGAAHGNRQVTWSGHPQVVMPQGKVPPANAPQPQVWTQPAAQPPVRR